MSIPTAEDIAKQFEQGEGKSTSSLLRQVKERNPIELVSEPIEKPTETPIKIKINQQPIEKSTDENGDGNEDWKIDESILTENRYSTVQLAELIQVSASSVRYWSNQLEDRAVHYIERNGRNDRSYLPEDVRIFYAIRHFIQVEKKAKTVEEAIELIEPHFTFRNAVPESQKEKVQKLKKIVQEEKEQIQATMNEIITEAETTTGVSKKELEELLIQSMNLFATSITQQLETRFQQQQTLLLESEETKKEQQALIQSLKEELQALKTSSEQRDQRLYQELKLLIESQQQNQPQGFFQKIKGWFGTKSPKETE